VANREREISFSVTTAGESAGPFSSGYLNRGKKLSPLFFFFSYNSYELVVPSNTLASTLSPLPSRPATTTTYDVHPRISHHPDPKPCRRRRSSADLCSSYVVQEKKKVRSVPLPGAKVCRRKTQKVTQTPLSYDIAGMVMYVQILV
jgi:hypothetical protein